MQEGISRPLFEMLVLGRLLISATSALSLLVNVEDVEVMGGSLKSILLRGCCDVVAAVGSPEATVSALIQSPS